MCPRWRSPLGVVTLVALALVLAVGTVLFTRSSAVGMTVLLLDLVFAIAAAAIHDRTHRRHGERVHAVLGLDDRHKPAFLQRR